MGRFQQGSLRREARAAGATWVLRFNTDRPEDGRRVPLHPVLAGHMSAGHRATPYSGEQDWVFPSFKLKGDKPRVANMLVEDHLRPAAIAAGVLKEGESVRFGFHNLRHSLASFLVQAGTNPKTVQTLLRHTDVHTTLQIYAHSRNEDRMTAQGDMLTAFFAPPTMVQ